MVNFGFTSASILGVFLAVAGAGLYFLRTIRPELSRDHDLFFAAVGLLCGLILVFQGWRLDPILQFGQFLITGSAVFFAVETIRLRGATTEQARRSSSYVDEDRRVSKTRVYTEAELDQLEPYEEEYPNNRRLGGYAEPRSGRNEDADSPSPRSRKPRRPPSDRPDRPSSGERPSDRYGRESGESRPRRPRPSSPDRGDSRADNADRWQEPTDDMWDETPPPRRPRRPRPSGDSPQGASSSTSTPSPRKRRPRPSEEGDYSSADYVDYQPIDDGDMRSQNDWEENEQRGSSSKPNRPEPESPKFDY